MKNIEDKLRAIYDRDAWMCQKPGCFQRATQIAHRVAKSKSNKSFAVDYAITHYGIKLKADDIIHHELNLVCSCGNPGHNDHFNIGNNPVRSEKLLKRIIEDIQEKRL